ncbi:SLC13 family permease [Pseudarthrobacter polychromogenes]|uniref:Sodium-dependent dicarboxylate transporter SdcS n=1 Tax=Pseudarthrobacter polychromogenes TaxID=1676 RepID=A0ABQ1XWU8_9MICC|nr:SLC13 family permease [Pseudarthrobacter polychromogenes]MBD1539192.1 anion transporter [Arthrobacter sp. S13_S34]GGH04960.1 di- and tricarboxylate transporter [Pseudarthrobacter polychromogenes]
MSEPSRRVIPEQGEFDEEPGEGRPPRRASRTWLVRGLGVALGVIVYFLLSGSGLSNDARVVAGVGTLMAVWWMTEAVPLSVTSLLPIALMPVLTERTIAETTAPYANPIVFLFLGGFLIAIAMQKWNLHRRIALLTLRRVGTHPRQIILGLMISTAFLSMWVSNTATTLMMLPIALSVLTLVVENSKHGAEAAVGTGGRDVGEELRAGGAVSDLIENREVRVFGVALVLAVAWSATIGGLGTLLGSPPNAIVAGYISDELGKTVGFAQWMMLGVPIVVVFIGLAWLLLTRMIFRFHLDEVPGGKQLINDEIAALGPMSQGEKIVRAVFVGAAFFWIVPGLLSNIGDLGDQLPFLDIFDDTVVAIAAGALLFIIPGDKQGNMTLNWKDAEEGLPWGVLLLFGGGLSLAAAVAGTGLDAWFGERVSGLGALPIILLLATVVLIVLFLTEITSNTATAATFIPILGGVAIGIGIDPMALLIPAALAATCAFMLPVGTPPNAIVFATGNVKISEMVRGGIVLNVVGVLLITIFTVLIGPFALGLVL